MEIDKVETYFNKLPNYRLTFISLLGRLLPATMNFQTSTPNLPPAFSSQPWVFARVEVASGSSLYNGKGNRRPTQGCYSMTD